MADLPAPALALAPATPGSLAQILRKDSLKLEAALGGRETIVGALLTAPLSLEQQQVVGLLGDPGYQEVSLAECCELAGTALPEFLRMLEAALMAKARLVALMQVSQQTPKVATDAMQLGQIQEQTCRPCKGTGTVEKKAKATRENPHPEPELVECSACDGLGTIQLVPSVDRQRTALELGGLLEGKGPSVQVAIQNNSPQIPAGIGGTLVDLQRAVQKILGGGRATPATKRSEPGPGVVEAQIVSEPSPLPTPAPPASTSPPEAPQP